MKRRVVSTPIEQPKHFEHLMNMYGLQRDEHDGYVGEYSNPSSQTKSVIHVNQTASGYQTHITNTTSEGSVLLETLEAADVENLISQLDSLVAKYQVELVAACTICKPDCRQSVILAAISTRDLTANLVRVKSSNVWAYAINIKNRKDRTGDVLCQFKNKTGGPGDIYIYYDVPVTLWRKWIVAPSKGHFFWQFIRNNFYYSKLTGDRRGVLKNAVN